MESTKLCECGCGQPTALAKQNDKRRGWIKGESVRFISGHNNWKGGRMISHAGYVLIKLRDRINAGGCGYIAEHILVAREMMGGSLLPGEEVHHRNKNKQDNRPGNLLVVPNSTIHREVERKQGTRVGKDEHTENEMIECACGCGEYFERFDKAGRKRTYLLHHQPNR